MQRFTTVREVKEFLVSRIVAEARREGVSLSETEEKMLYFSETGWTLPDIWEVNAAFDRDYDTDDYEEKIADIVRGFRKYALQYDSAELELWNDAVRLLRKEDHYLLVMVDMAAFDPTRTPGEAGRRLAMVVLSGVVFHLCHSLSRLFVAQV